MLGTTVRIVKTGIGKNTFRYQVPSAHCSQCDKTVERCPHVTAYFDAHRYAPCDCPTHVHRRDPVNTPCIMVEYLDGRRPGKMASIPGIDLPPITAAWRVKMKAARGALGMSQTELGELLGLANPQPAISLIETQSHHSRLVPAICKALNIAAPKAYEILEYDTRWTWPDGQPTVRCMNCGAEWLEPVIGTYIGRAKAQG